MNMRIKITLLFTFVTLILLCLLWGLTYFFSDTKLVLGIGIVGAIGIALILGYFFSKILLRPVKRIADEVNSISAQSLAHRIKSGNSEDEWNYLTNTLNDLLNRLQESFEIQRRFISSD